MLPPARALTDTVSLGGQQRTGRAGRFRSPGLAIKDEALYRGALVRSAGTTRGRKSRLGGSPERFARRRSDPIGSASSGSQLGTAAGRWPNRADPALPSGPQLRANNLDQSDPAMPCETCFGATADRASGTQHAYDPSHGRTFAGAGWVMLDKNECPRRHAGVSLAGA